jgi:biotin carboxylase
MEKGKLLIIEPSSSGIALISAASTLGFDPVVLTYNQGDRIVPVEHLDMAADVIEVDTSDELAMADAIRRYTRQHRVVGIVPGFEYYVAVVARLSHQLKLRGLDPGIVDNLRYKNQMRARLSACGIASPRYLTVSSIAMLDQIAECVGYPCVVKPINGSGSLHVTKVYNQAELETAYAMICQDEMVDMGLRMSHTAIVESYVSGPEFSVEGYVQDNQVFFLSVTEKMLCQEPYFVEIGHIVNAPLGRLERAALCEYTESIVRALGIDMGPFHCEVRACEGRPIAMEIAARLPGDCIVELILESIGVNLAEVMIKTYLGIEVASPPPENDRCAGVCFFTLNNSNYFSGIEGVAAVERLPGFKRFELLAKPASYVPPPINSLGRAAKAIFAGASYQQLKTEMAQANRLIRFY